jgi:hypothetical protein
MSVTAPEFIAPPSDFFDALFVVTGGALDQPQSINSPQSHSENVGLPDSIEALHRPMRCWPRTFDHKILTMTPRRVWRYRRARSVASALRSQNPCKPRIGTRSSALTDAKRWTGTTSPRWCSPTSAAPIWP